MTQTLYSLRTDPSGYRITKFVDGEVESSYLTSTDVCECPAGHRHTCRHRQMLPQMLAHGIADTHWFMDWDRSGSIVDFQGGSKRLYDQLAAAATCEISETLAVDNDGLELEYEDEDEIGYAIEAESEAVGEALLVASAEDTTMTAECPPGCCEPFPTPVASPEPAPQQQSGRSWRRL